MSKHRSGAKRASAPLAASRPSQLWWVYFGYLLVMAVAGSFVYLPLVREANLLGRLRVLPVAATLLNLWGVIGLWGYIQSRRLVGSWFWQACVGLTVIQWIFATSLFLLSLPNASGKQAWVTIAGLAGMALGLPLIVALWRYAFLSPRVWAR